MKLFSVTLSSNRPEVIGDALRSVVDWVDKCLIVDLGITDSTLEVARSVAGDKLEVVKYKSDNWDQFSEIRNFGLDSAYAKGADWACILDTDERMKIGSVDVRSMLEATDGDIVLVPFSNGAYCKERFFRFPLKDRYTGRDHECVVPKNGKHVYYREICFEELPKSKEVLEKKLLLLVDHLGSEIEREPNNPRLHYYMGDTLAGLGRGEEALREFDKCAALRGWDEESAWACFRMAVILEKMGRRQDAIDLCAVGMSRHSGIAELPWFAGEISLSMGKFDKAVYWARIAVANGTLDGEDHFIKPRIGFRYPFGAKEGPYDLMARAYDALGKTEEAEKCREILKEKQ